MSTFDNWWTPIGQPTKAHNQWLAAAHGGTFLDAKLIRTEFHSRGIEARDVLTDDGVLLHVKDLKSPAPASHLLAEAHRVRSAAAQPQPEADATGRLRRPRPN